MAPQQTEIQLSALEDIELVKRISASHPPAEQDEQAEARLYQKYLEKVLLVLRHYLPDPEDRKEICQDVFLQVIANCRARQIQKPERLSSYIQSVARHKALDWRDKILIHSGTPTFSIYEINDPKALLNNWRDGREAVSQYICDQLTETQREKLCTLVQENSDPPANAVYRLATIILNQILKDDKFFNEERFKSVKLPAEALNMSKAKLGGERLHRLNRLLLEAAYPAAIKPRDLDQPSIPRWGVLVREPIADDDSSEEAVKNEKQKLLQAAIQNLKPEEKRLYEMFYIKKMTLKEISDKINLAEFTATKRLQRLREKLKKMVQKLK